MNAPAVECNDISVRAGRRTLLEIEALSIPRGRMTALLGPNGAGKSTLLRCLLGVQPHCRGELRVLGEPIGRLGSGGRAALRRRIGYVPQPLPERTETPLTVREVVAIGRTGLAGLGRRLRGEDWREVDRWLERLGLAALARRGFGEISGGEQRKALIARAMVSRPELLLLDEPVANLDLGWRERIVRTIAELYDAGGLTVVLVCHELEVIPPRCGRVLVLEEGSIVADGAPDAVLTTERIASLYGPHLAVVRNAGRWAVVPGEANRD